MRNLSLILTLGILGACAEQTGGSTNVQLNSQEVVAEAGDRAVTIGSWVISQDRYDSVSFNELHLRALVWYEDQGWKRPADYDTTAVDPECYDVSTTNRECYVNPRPELTIFQQTFELCWLESNDHSDRVSSGFTFATDGHVQLWNVHLDVTDDVVVNLVCDIGQNAPQMTFSVVPMWIEGIGHDNQYPSDPITYYTRDDEAQQAVVTIN